MMLMKKFNMAKIKVDFKLVSIITTIIGVILIYLNFLFYGNKPDTFTSLNIIIPLEMLGLPLIYRNRQYQKVRKIESKFPQFLIDVTENINAGMTLPQAIRATQRVEYGELNPYVKEISSKISWGISFEKTLNEFTAAIGSDSLKRTTQTIIEAYKAGGTMNTVLAAVADSLQQLEKIKLERSASVYGQMINGYMIYVIFLGVMIGISSFLVPTFQFEGAAGSSLQNVFPEMFRGLSVIQGFFAGMAIGKMSEGNLAAGVKHSLALSIMGYSVFTLLG